MEILTTSNIMFTLGVIGTIIGVYKSINNPQKELEKGQAINEERDKSKATLLEQKEVDTKAQLLAQQMNTERENNNRRFEELGKRLDASFLLASNHIHTVDTKVDILTKEVSGLTNKITELATIINERIPCGKK